MKLSMTLSKMDCRFHCCPGVCAFGGLVADGNVPVSARGLGTQRRLAALASLKKEARAWSRLSSRW
jgi:hypothetical protein